MPRGRMPALLGEWDVGVKQVAKERKRNYQRSEVEGKFGEAKNRYEMDRLQIRFPQTTTTLFEGALQ